MIRAYDTVDGRNPAPVGNRSVTMKHGKQWDYREIEPYTNWRRISSIHRIYIYTYIWVVEHPLLTILIFTSEFHGF